MLYIYKEINIYDDIINNLLTYYKRNNIECKITNVINPSSNNYLDLYIIFGMHDFHGQNVPKNYIVYQLEQSTANDISHYFSETYLNFLRNAKEVWDYSLVNYMYLENHKIKNCVYKPIRSLEKCKKCTLTDESNVVVWEWDFLFLGRMNERRSKILETFKNFKINIIEGNIPHDQLCDLFRKSRYLINIHYYPCSILETTRLSMLLTHNCNILSEKSFDKILDNEYSSFIHFLDFKDIEDIEDIEDKNNIEYFVSKFPPKNTDLYFFQEYNYEISKYDYLYTQTQTQNPQTQTQNPQTQNPQTQNPQTQNHQEDNYQIGNISDLNKIIIPDNKLPNVTIITLTNNRPEIFRLAIDNWNRIDYPRNKLEWIIVNDSNELYYKKYKEIISAEKNIKHYKLSVEKNKRLSIAQKRNFGIENASHEYIVHMDDDDYYFPDSVINRIKFLYSSNLIECVGTTNLDIHDIVNDSSARIKGELFSEASLAFKKSFHNKRKFNEKFNTLGEGYEFCLNRKSSIINIPSNLIMIAITHKNNYTGKLRSHTHNNVNGENLLSYIPFNDKLLLYDIFE